MGCDIHLYVEKRGTDGVWRPADKFDRDEDERFDVPYGKHFYDERNYDLFAILADVRNGFGFAGVVTGGGFNVMSPPRGIPENVSAEVATVIHDWGEDGHSHSYQTLDELLEYDWTQVSTLQGWVDAVEWAEWSRWRRTQGLGPRSYSGDVSGAGIVKFKAPEMDAFIAAKDTVNGVAPDRVYGLAVWREPYFRAAGSFWAETMPRLSHLAVENGNGLQNVRIVYFFDN